MPQAPWEDSRKVQASQGPPELLRGVCVSSPAPLQGTGTQSLHATWLHPHTHPITCCPYRGGGGDPSEQSPAAFCHKPGFFHPSRWLTLSISTCLWCQLLILVKSVFVSLHHCVRS